MNASKKYLHDIAEHQNHAANKIFQWIENGIEVLEVGCASGVQTRHLKENLNCQVTGIEIDPVAAEDARPFCKKLIIGNIEQLVAHDALGDQLFDVISFVDVLEHLLNPTDALIKVRPYLKEGGHLLASIPNVAHAAICWEIAHGRFDYQQYGLLDDTHIRFFTKKNVARLFEEAGYEIVAWDRVVKQPQETEFGVRCSSAQDESFLDWIYENNKEALTYQFIVKARPSNKYQEDDPTYQFLKSTIKELEERNAKLKSDIDWLENHRFGRLSKAINKIKDLALYGFRGG
jgi:2-polyprenyl-3-methyl-5-hydroxy-6-metoxy-1,4-benzoquinol methylase